MQEKETIWSWCPIHKYQHDMIVGDTCWQALQAIKKAVRSPF